mgnify:CR=1 FL=1|jgi:hypothetical protein
MDAALYILLGLGGIVLVYLLHRHPQLAGAVFLLSVTVGAAVYLLQ